MREAMSGGKDWRRATARRFLVPLAIAIAGIVVIAIGSGTAEIVGGGVLALAVTVAISLAFLEVGYSEDRARERDERGPP
jgi:formate hydrogenlyase subunit 3/multisubunit Na+/H+ antiporter MnhD subunit